VNSELNDTVRATVVLAGVDSPFLTKKTQPAKKKVKARKITKKVPAKRQTTKKLKKARTRATKN
jgi:hypothetical protein